MKTVLDNLARMAEIANNIQDMKKFWSVAGLSILMVTIPICWIWWASQIL